MGSTTMKVGALFVAVAALAGGGVAWATAAGGDDRPLTGSALERASVAALEATGGGVVIETEVGDDGAVYGVEIRLADGREVEVNLDEDFKVIGQANDDDGANEEDGPNDD
jgi:hypothetical protein